MLPGEAIQANVWVPQGETRPLMAPYIGTLCNHNYKPPQAFSQNAKHCSAASKLGWSGCFRSLKQKNVDGWSGLLC